MRLVVGTTAAAAGRPDTRNRASQLVTIQCANGVIASRTAPPRTGGRS